ncbi:MAG: discoidin domain-containing protein, partial [Planctomycetes bacterium]|nr:discoidin domain-containing protein [Planctomycetota bacterium]
MSKKLIYLMSIVLVLWLSVGVASAQPLNQSSGPDGIVSVEAEHFDANVEVGGHKWEETGPTGGFTGVLGMHSPNGNGGHSSNYAANSERLEYEINFVKTGPHYVWILAWAASGTDDSCHAGLDGEETPLSDNLSGWNGDYEWNNGRYQRPERAQIEITSTGVHTLNIWVREDGLIIDKIVLTTNPDFTLTGSEPGPPESPRGALLIASDPNPTDDATDVPRDVVLSWTPGELAAPTNGHKVYLSESFNDVNDGIGAITQSASSYAPAQRLDFSKTYYWRVDEVNGPPDYTVFEGDVWSFTTEPFVYAVENITATASSTGQEGMDPENTINGSGLDANDLHSTEATDMWLSGDEPNGAWIEYELDKVHKLHEMWVWNANQTMESILGLGYKDVSIEYSVNGTDYTTLDITHEFARAPGAVDYAHNTTVDFSGVTAKYVRLTANNNWGNLLLDQFGLSEVRFFYIPVYAREPSPDSGTTDVSIGTIDETIDVTLGFRAGREADKHDVYFSSDWQAVADGNAPVATVTETNYGPLSLDLGTTYYWRVDEVNEVETPTTWQSDIWNFTTQKYFVVDDFEDYNDYPPDEIWATWVDGYGVPTNGATVGYPNPDWGADEHYVETAIVHG